MKTSYSFICSALLIITNITAQKSVNPTEEHIAHAELLSSIYPDDEILILNSNENITFDYNKSDNLVEVNQKLNEELMNIVPRSDIQKYVMYDNTTKIKNFSTKLRNGKPKYFAVKDEFYESGDIFYHDARVKYMNIDFPVKGYKYKYNLEKEYSDIKYFTKIAFNNEYPILEKKVSFYIPDWLQLKVMEFNLEGYEINKEEKYDEKKKATEYTYTIKNMPAFPTEKNAPGPSHYQPHVLVIAKSMTKDENKVNLFPETQQLYDWYKSLVDSMEDDTAVLKSKVDELTEDAKTDDEKIKNIYYWVQDNIRYIAFEDGIAGFKPDESQNVFTKRYGDCKGMANLTKKMLVLAGFDARLTWIGTKRIAYDYSIPSLAVDNHMICSLIDNGKTYFLDSTEKYNSFGEYAERIQGRPVLIENGDEYILDNIPNGIASKNKEITNYDFEISDDKIIGTVNKTYQGESRSHFLHSYNSIKTNKKENALNAYLSKADKNCQVTDVNTTDLENRDNDITIDYSISLDNKISSFDDEVYIDLEYGNHFKDLDLSERELDLEFPYKTHVEYNTTLKIPNGYSIKEIPEDFNVQTEDFNISITIIKKNNTLEYNKKFVLNKAAITKTNFEKWNSAVKQLNNIYQEQVILIKNNNTK
ncbi:transglutaminase domain-containing protein [Maribacter sp. HTCC2170]|uniref:transglutaminase domain-containing protein n=1 Tax=Maribacter sp. (strain HTCC2170 / KCCM 42371) TaxID=313603 RepID=UPI00006BD42B|nr:transglutaminase domain-containing protein [Maribacter sp. HTCC2170]EAR02084.1 hypothetical protein FB2170_02335 [Maribacter sp. HTCC2170]